MEEKIDKILEKLVGVDERLDAVDARFDAVDARFDVVDFKLEEFRKEINQKLMDGITMLDRKIDLVEVGLLEKIDEIAISKADREEVFSLHKRFVRLEKKLA